MIDESKDENNNNMLKDLSTQHVLKSNVFESLNTSATADQPGSVFHYTMSLLKLHRQV